MRSASLGSACDSDDIFGAATVVTDLAVRAAAERLFPRRTPYRAEDLCCSALSSCCIRREGDRDAALNTGLGS